MKVLGFRPWQILLLVLSEALVIGALSGLISAGGAYYIVNEWAGGIPFPIAFFPAFNISKWAPWWGLGIGTGAALAGSLLPAIQACRVRVATEAAVRPSPGGTRRPCGGCRAPRRRTGAVPRRRTQTPAASVQQPGRTGRRTADRAGAGAARSSVG